MKPFRLAKNDRIGLLRPVLDAHTLGLTTFAQLLGECGFYCLIADRNVCASLPDHSPSAPFESVAGWVHGNGITVLGFSYRLDPKCGMLLFGHFCQTLRDRQLLYELGGPIRGLLFAGLPETCQRVTASIPEVSAVFMGDETPAETLRALGVQPSCLPHGMLQLMRYDEDRLAFGRDLVRTGKHLSVSPADRSGYREFGGRSDTLVARLNHATRLGQPPLMRAHVGPYHPDRAEAVAMFMKWTKHLARTGFLDVLSIGTSQLTQEAFGEDWADRPNGGGVPLNSPEEYAAAWQAARPMLVRTYAGTNRIPTLAAMYERTINIAWHALSFWWFCRLDGRGPLTVAENLQQHLETISLIAATGKPLEANVAHHFSFRGADDVTAVTAVVMAARTAKSLGIRRFVLQVMLNTPKTTCGMQDLAKARAMLELTREMEDGTFRVILQPRGGLDYFSPDVEKAKAQLAAVTALMDDIEPIDVTSPPLIHVVSYSEANNLADPDTVNESIQVTRQALQTYRQLRKKGLVDDMTRNPEVVRRTDLLLTEVRTLLSAIGVALPNCLTATGLHSCFEMGFLPTPHLWAERDRFARATVWQTKVVDGGTRLVDNNGNPLTMEDRISRIAALGKEGPPGARD